MQPSETSYPPSATAAAPAVAQQPNAIQSMNVNSTTKGDSQNSEQREALRLRGGCPGKLCGLPILPCRCDICIIPIPCC